MKHRPFVRLLGAAALLLPPAPPPAAAQAPELSIELVGNAGVVLSDGVTSLLLDLPYEPGAFGYQRYDPARLRPTGEVVAVITHHHRDHFAPELFLSRGGWRVIGPPSAVAAVPPGRVTAGDSVAVGDFEVVAVPTPHTDDHRSYRIRWRGRVLHFTGDTEDGAALLAGPRVDLLFLTPWLACTLEAAGRAPATARAVLYHRNPDGSDRRCGSAEPAPQGTRFTLAPAPPTLHLLPGTPPAHAQGRPTMEAQDLVLTPFLDLGFLFARVLIGLLIAAHGAQKLFGWFGGHGLAGTAGFFEGLGFRPGRLFALAAGLGEFTSGVLIAVGLFGPVGPALMLAVMLVAAISVHWRNGLFATNNGIEMPLLYGIAAVRFALTGPGRHSLDSALGLHWTWTPRVIWIALAAGLVGGLASLIMRKRPAAAA